MADEWTFVSHRKGKASKRGRHPHHSAGHSGLYGASAESKHRVGENDGCNNIDQQCQDEKERLKRDVLQCICALENQLRIGKGFAHHLVTSMVVASTCNPDNDKGIHRQNQNEARRHRSDIQNNVIGGSPLRLREIVAYGIGNFATGRFQAPMLQLACLLLIRRFATDASQFKNEGAINGNLNMSCSFDLEQKRVPIFYYEPCILPVEKELLESVFQVHVLESNDMGKRTVESMIKQHKTNICESPLSISDMKGKSHSNHTHSLFYMPHCPIQLYCNVLWAHWSHIFKPDEQYSVNSASDEPINLSFDDNNPILIFGNSFHTYEERTICSEKRLDPSNGVFQVVPFTKEIPIDGCGNNHIIDDALRHLEMAFNDCNIIYFPLETCDEDCHGGPKQRVSTRWPDRPMEWIASKNINENGELLK